MDGSVEFHPQYLLGRVEIRSRSLAVYEARASRRDTQREYMPMVLEIIPRYDVRGLSEVGMIPARYIELQLLAHLARESLPRSLARLYPSAEERPLLPVFRYSLALLDEDLTIRADEHGAGDAFYFHGR